MANSKPFKVFATVAESHSLILKHVGEIRAVLATIGLGLFTILIVGDLELFSGSLQSSQLFIYGYLAFYWHRLVLLGMEAIDLKHETFGKSLKQFGWRVAGFGLLEILFVTACVILFMEGHQFVAMLLAVVPSYIGCRLVLVLPANAIGQKFGFRDSWKLSKGVSFRLFFVIVTCFFLLLLGAVLIGNALIALEPKGSSIAFIVFKNAIIVFFNLYMSLLGVGVITLAFQKLYDLSSPSSSSGLSLSSDGGGLLSPMAATHSGGRTGTFGRRNNPPSS